MKKVLVTSRSFGSGDKPLVAQMNEAGVENLSGPSHHAVGEIREALAKAEGWIAGTGPILKEHLDAAPHLKVIARYGVGTDAIDLAEAERRNITVTNTPGANSHAVADLTIGLVLEGLRHLSTASQNLRQGNWEAVPGRELGALTVGIAGLGRIGQGVAKRLTGFGTRVIAYDPFADDSVFVEHGVEAAEWESLVSQSEVITLHAPGGEQLVTPDTLALTTAKTVLVNTARADLIDEHAVAEALRGDRLGFYVADVLHTEGRASTSPLLAADLADRVTLTPHIAAQTVQAIDEMGSMAWANVHAVLNGKDALHPVTYQR